MAKSKLWKKELHLTCGSRQKNYIDGEHMVAGGPSKKLAGHISISMQEAGLGRSKWGNLYILTVLTR